MIGTITGGKLSACGLLLGLMSQSAFAQSLGLPASDPVGIGRSGTGVAFGASLEAASLNPALLVTMREPRSAYLGMGMEMQAAQTTSEANQSTLWSSDRNRVLPSLGAAWRLHEAFAVGLKVDQPYLRHREYPFESSLRFLGRAIDLNTRRVELQGAWAVNEQWSLGLSAGMTRVDYASEVSVRVPVPGAQALMEVPLRQEGSSNAFGYTLGFRWAINPRWTLGGTYQAAMKISPDWNATIAGGPSYSAEDGLSAPPSGASVPGAALLAASRALPGSGQLVLPARMALGVRQRVNQFFTWEIDLRYVFGGALRQPGQPVLSTPGGQVSSPAGESEYRNGMGFSAMGEFTLSKRWTARIGAEFVPPLATTESSNPLLGGSRAAGFSLGGGYKALGGEFSFGYQFRQSLSQDSTGLDGVWDVNGYRTTGSRLRNEGKGHLWAFGYKRAF